MPERELLLPDLGEGLADAVLVRWLVGDGEAVELNQPIAEIETAKATVEIPSPFAGRVATRHWAEGSTVPVGAPLVSFDVASDGDDAEAARHAAVPVGATPAVRRLARERGQGDGAVLMASASPGGRA